MSSPVRVCVLFFLHRIGSDYCDDFFFSRSLKFMEDCVIVPLPVRASHRHVSLPPDFVGQPAKARRCQRRMLVTIVSEKLATYSDAFLFGRAPLQSECVNL